MTFPYRHANGNICCSTREGCCPNCEAKLAAEKRTLRSAEDFSAPNPYEAGIDALRLIEAKAAAKRTYQPAALRPTEFPTGYAPPDPYKAAIARLREENNR